MGYSKYVALMSTEKCTSEKLQQKVDSENTKNGWNTDILGFIDYYYHFLKLEGPDYKV